MVMPSYAVKLLLEASLDTLVAGRRRPAGIRTIQAMESPPLVRLIPEVFNIKYLSSLASRSYLLSGLSSVFAALKYIESGRMQTLIEGRAESEPSEVNGPVSDIWQQLWRLTRTRIPPIQRGDLQQRRVREAAAVNDGIFLVQEAEEYASYQSASRNRSFSGEGPNHQVGTEIGACESYDIYDPLSDSETGQYDDGENGLAPEVVDNYRYLTPPLAMNNIAVQHEGEVDDDEACHVEPSVDHDDRLDLINSGDASSPFAPFSREASPDFPEFRMLYQTDVLEDRDLTRNPMPMSCSTGSQAMADHACGPFSNWWSSDVDLVEDQPVTHGGNSELQKPMSASPQSECHSNRAADEDAFQEPPFEAESDAGSCSHNEGIFEGSDDAYWEPMSQACLYSTTFLEDIGMRDNFEDEWTM
ncbi:uncharacterized protein ColSpa_07190 [Colletotrichum spaethianum]|uniref:Uncharacterized protein n=1 Tax=Colletotrichum spaethianum TaxID=700344 RepID=A0AA37LIR8_9PEZI|nr:uncharacterized protein ColSpa_07190 [Colletotrichum spaethianum]GKT47009.1 hypothetical protein ColSpa_07190 [Colletotrichum spaethianum]